MPSCRIRRSPDTGRIRRKLGKLQTMNLRRHGNVAHRDLYLNGLVASSIVPYRLRNAALRRAGHDIHPTAGINPRVFLGARQGLTVGAHAFINYGCFFDLGAETTIGAHTHLAYEVMALTCTHEAGDAAERAGKMVAEPVQIGEGCWIGARVVIQPGVTIGDGCVIASGSVVTEDCRPDTMYAGVPARAKHHLDQIE